MALFRNQNAVRYNTSARGYATKTSRKQQTPTGFSKLSGTNGKKRAVFFVGSALVLLFATAGVLRLVTGSWTGARAATYNNPYYGRCMPFPALRPSLGEGARDDNGNGGNGQCVQALQFALNNAYGARLSINGVFDAKTKQAVVALQNSAGTKADAPGTVGVETWSVIENTMKQKGGAGYQTPAQIWQNGQAQITGITPAHNNSPIGYIDSCKLEGTTTVFRGWAYDYDIESVRVNLAIAGSTGAEGTVSSNITGPRHAAIEAWLPTQKNPFAKRKAYEFEWKVTTLQNDRNYTIGGVLKNHGPGVDTVIDVDINNFPGGVVPKSCTKPAPPAPVVVTPAPATTPATPKPAAQTALNHDPTGYIDTCEVRGSKTVFKGWMYDMDGEPVTSRLKVTGDFNDTVSVESKISSYRTAEIDAFLESKQDGSRPGGPKRKAYGFEATFSSLQNDRNYSISGIIANTGAGNSTNMRFDQNRFEVNGVLAKIPTNCLPAPAAVPQAEKKPVEESKPVEAAPEYSHDPLAYVDSCELKDGKTVLYGWAYDPDGVTSVNIRLQGGANLSKKDIPANISGYRTTQISDWIKSKYPGAPLHSAGYGFTWEISGVYKGKWYNVYGDVKNEGGNNRLGFEQIWGDPNAAPEGGRGIGFPAGRIPDGCMADAPAQPAPPKDAGGSGGTIDTTPAPKPDPTPASPGPNSVTVTCPGLWGLDFSISVTVSKGQDGIAECAARAQSYCSGLTSDGKRQRNWVGGRCVISDAVPTGPATSVGSKPSTSSQISTKYELLQSSQACYNTYAKVTYERSGNKCYEIIKGTLGVVISRKFVWCTNGYSKYKVTTITPPYGAATSVITCLMRSTGVARAVTLPVLAQVKSKEYGELL